MRLLPGILILFIGTTSFAHESQHHDGPAQGTKLSDLALESTFEDINTHYSNDVQPIFAVKCAACHSDAVTAPWYSKIPGVGSLIKKDREEAKEHLELSGGFPFRSHAKPIEDLTAIRDVVEKGSMPTRLYSFMHPSSRLTAKEKEVIVNWATASEAKLHAAESKLESVGSEK